MKRVLTSVVLAATAFAQVMSPAPAKAEAMQLQVSIEVSYSDLDISTHAGAKILLGRMQRAARTVCGGAQGFGHLALQMNRMACRRDAVARAAASLHAPQLSALLIRRNSGWQLAAR